MPDSVRYTREQTFDWGSILWFTEPADFDTERVSVGLAAFVPGSHHVKHVHSREEQVLYVMSGHGVHIVNGRIEALEPGIVLHTPPYVEHELFNTGDTELKVLLVYSPARFPPLLAAEQDKTGPHGKHAAGSELRSLFDSGAVDSIQATMEQLSQALGLSLALLDTKGNCMLKTANHPRFCSYLAEHTDGAYCRKHLHTMFRELDALPGEALNKPRLFYCCHNIASTIIPVVCNGTTQAYMKCGEIFLSTKDKEHLRTLLPRIAAACCVPGELLADMAEDLPVEPKSRLYTAAEATFTIASTIVGMAAAAFKQQELNESKLSLTREQLASANLEKALREADLKILQSQVNPHFLFNTLNTIAQIAYIEGAPRATELVWSLSDLLRFTLRKTEALIPLREELSLLNSYMHIQQERFGDRLAFALHVDEEALSVLVPCMLFQPLIENSIIHGFESLSCKGEIVLRVQMHGQRILASITDNGVGFDPGSVSSDPKKIGLCSTGARLEHYFGKEGQRFSVLSAPGEGTRIDIEFPAACGDTDA